MSRMSARYRDVVEASLKGTGLSQADVVNWLADELLADLMQRLTSELCDIHDSIAEGLLRMI